MNLKPTPEELKILTDALLSPIDASEVEGIDDPVEASQKALAQLAGKLQIAQRSAIRAKGHEA